MTHADRTGRRPAARTDKDTETGTLEFDDDALEPGDDLRYEGPISFDDVDEEDGHAADPGASRVVITALLIGAAVIMLVGVALWLRRDAAPEIRVSQADESAATLPPARGTTTSLEDRIVAAPSLALPAPEDGPDAAERFPSPAEGPEETDELETQVAESAPPPPVPANLARFPFLTRASDAERAEIHEAVRKALDKIGLGDNGHLYVELETTNEMTNRFLLERHLISRELADLEAGAPVRRGAALVVERGIGVMVNEEDHLRLQVVKSGFGPLPAYAEMEPCDRELGGRVPFAFHEEFGYLTSCPTNAGTGLRASVLIHLPGLVLTKEIAKVLQGLTQVGLTFRGLHGEGSEVVGNLFQLSNQTTLGKSEEELLDHLTRIVRQVIAYEQQAREVLVRNAPTVIADKVWRAYGLLRYARSLSFEETMNLLSGVRLGVGLDLIGDVSVYTLNKLLVFTQPAHVARRAERALTDPDLPAIRAGLVRQLLEEDARRRPPGGPAAAEA